MMKGPGDDLTPTFIIEPLFYVIWYNRLKDAVVLRRLATPLRKGVMQMGNGRRARALRFAICFIVILAIMIYIAPKAC